MTQMTDSTKNVTITSSNTEMRVYSTLTSSLSLLSLRKAMSSLSSLTNALMTAIPEKFSCAKSDRSENACWRFSHVLVMVLPITVPMANMNAAGMRASMVMRLSMHHIR